MEKITFSKFCKGRMLRQILEIVVFLIGISVLCLLDKRLMLMKDMELKVGRAVERMYTFADVYGSNEYTIKYAISSTADSWRNSFDSMDCAMAVTNLYDKEEVIATSEMSAFMIWEENHQNPKVLVCEEEGLLKLQEKYADRSKQFELENFFIKGNEFLPGRVLVRDVEYLEVEHIDFATENSEGYTYYEGDYDRIAWVYGTDRDSKALLLLKEELASYDNDFRQVTGWGTYTDMHLFTLGKTDYALYSTFTVDIWQTYGVMLLVIWGLGLTVGIGASWFEVDCAYRKYCTQYEIDAYRRHMTSALAHDLKTPLAAIMGYSVNLKENIHSEKKDYYLDAVIENVQYMNDIITGTLELAKVEESTEKLNKTSLELVALADELLSKYRTGLESRGIAVELSGDFQVMADKNLMSRAVDNLLSNAVKYTPDNGKIMIQANKTAFTVSNTCDKNLNGNTEEFCKAFAKFDDSRSDRKGSGIGLTIVRNITVLHGLEFDVSASDGVFQAVITKK